MYFYQQTKDEQVVHLNTSTRTIGHIRHYSENSFLMGGFIAALSLAFLDIDQHTSLAKRIDMRIL